MPFIGRIAVACLTTACAFGQLREQPAPASPGVPRTDYIVSFAESTTPTQRTAAVLRAGAQVQRDLPIVKALAVRVSNINVLGALQRDLSVVSIREDLPLYATAKPGAEAPEVGKSSLRG